MRTSLTFFDEHPQLAQMSPSPLPLSNESTRDLEEAAVFELIIPYSPSYPISRFCLPTYNTQTYSNDIDNINDDNDGLQIIRRMPDGAGTSQAAQHLQFSSASNVTLSSSLPIMSIRRSPRFVVNLLSVLATTLTPCGRLHSNSESRQAIHLDFRLSC